MYSVKGNIAFMSIVSLAAVLSTVSIVTLGFTAVSLALLMVLTIGSVIVGKWVESIFEAKELAAYEAALKEVDEEKS